MLFLVSYFVVVVNVGFIIITYYVWISSLALYKYCILVIIPTTILTDIFHISFGKI